MNATTLIVDDEPAARALLEQYVEEITSLRLASSFADPLKAFNFLLKNPVDIVLLDINMPQLSGLELSRSISEKTAIIFTTAYSNYALESFGAGAIDYLVKPIPLGRFLTAIRKAFRYIGKDFRGDMRTMAQFALKIDGREKTIDPARIKYIQGFGNYIKVYTTSEMLLATETMKNVEGSLQGQGFLRVHRSYLVNTEFISHYTEKLNLKGEIELPVGPLYKKDLLGFLKNKG